MAENDFRERALQRAGAPIRWLRARQVWRRDYWEIVADADPTRIVNDVFLRPSVGRGAAVIVTALVSLIVGLTWTCAPGGVFGAPPETGCPIPSETGAYTVYLVGTLVFFAAIEHLAGPWIDDRAAEFARWRARQARPIRVATGLGVAVTLLLGWVIYVVCKLLSILVSLVDWVFARGLAFLAGATLRPWPLRYAWFFGLVGGLGALHLVAPQVGYYGVAAAIALVFAMARRWSWIERDREAFLISRKMRSTRPVAIKTDKTPVLTKTTRIGFGEDLRDEALLGILALFVLTPLLMAQVHVEHKAFGVLSEEAEAACKAREKQPDANPCGVGDLALDAQPDLATWIAFFGGELAKSVPLVDWSEVFNVENKSRIKPATATGARLIFGVRMTLDLLLIASVLLAIQIASRLRDRTAAFEAKDLDILDPFAEWRAFNRLDQDLKDLEGDPLVGLTLNPALLTFDHYRPERLIEIALSEDPSAGAPARVTLDDDTRRAALVALVVNTKEPEAAWSLAKARALMGDARERAPISELLSDPGAPAALKGAATRLALDAPAAAAADALTQLLEAPEPEKRRDAAWRIGLRRDRAAGAQIDGLKRMLLDADLRCRAQAALSLARATAIKDADLAPLRSQAAGSSDLTARMTVAAASETLMSTLVDASEWAWLRGTPDPTPEDFAAELVAWTQRGFRRIAEPDGGPLHFLQGSPEGVGRENEKPQTPVSLAPFDLAATATPGRLFAAYAGANAVAMGKQDPEHPVVAVSWFNAMGFCAWASRVTGDALRLPSEAEWEGACRGGGGSAEYWWGEDFEAAPAHANHSARRRRGRVSVRISEADLALGPLPPFGLHHMAGNVFEWCLDPWIPSYAQHPGDGRPGTLSGEFSMAVLRGGSWENVPWHLRSAYRDTLQRDARLNLIGFRVARTLVD